MSDNFLNELIREANTKAEKDYYRKKINEKKNKKNSSKKKTKRMNFDQWRSLNNKPQRNEGTNNKGPQKNTGPSGGKEVIFQKENQKSKEKSPKESYKTEKFATKKAPKVKFNKSELKKAVIYAEILGKPKSKR